MATCIELLANARRATGTGKAEVANYLLRAQQIRAGKPPKVNIVKAFRAALAALRSSPFTGDPPADWLTAKRALRESGEAVLLRAARQLDFIVAFQRGHRTSAALSAEWLRNGAYTRARAALDSALAQEQILDGAEPPRGVQVMNWHKAKGKQFDAVILLREGRFGDGGLESSFIWRGDQPPYPKSRRLVRVAATRARDGLIILNPNWPACPLLKGHILHKG